MQDGKPISFASRSLTKNEVNYSQIEKEFLSILYALKKFHFYAYGRNVKVVNDHKPLLGIIKKEIHEIPADYLSRYTSPLVNENDEDKTITESVLTVNVSDDKKNEMKQKTEQDETLKQVKEYCKNGWPANKSDCPNQLLYYYRLRDDIILDDDILFYHERIIIPGNMRREIVTKLHESHFGLTKTKQRARQSVFWPSINNDIEQIITNCRTCQLKARNNQKEPLIQHEIPMEPFKKVACDILEHGTKNYLVLIDFFSKSATD